MECNNHRATRGDDYHSSRFHTVTHKYKRELHTERQWNATIIELRVVPLRHLNCKEINHCYIISGKFLSIRSIIQQPLSYSSEKLEENQS